MGITGIITETAFQVYIGVAMPAITVNIAVIHEN